MKQEYVYTIHMKNNFNYNKIEISQKIILIIQEHNEIMKLQVVDDSLSLSLSQLIPLILTYNIT